MKQYLKRHHRDQLIVDMRRQGKTLEEIGHDFDLTRERVRQIVKTLQPELAGENVRELKRIVREAKADAKLLIIKRIVEHQWTQIDHLTIDQIATRLGVTSEDLRQALSPQQVQILMGNLASKSEAYERWTDAECKKALRDAARLSSPLTASTYTDLRDSGRISGPSLPRLHQRFGSWTAACAFAHVSSGKAIRDYSSKWTDAQLFAIVQEFLNDSSQAPHTFAIFDRWLQDQGNEYPSSATVRNRLGKWNPLRADALRQLQNSKAVA